jgi:hypothetical protein
MNNYTYDDSYDDEEKLPFYSDIHESNKFDSIEGKLRSCVTIYDIENIFRRSGIEIMDSERDQNWLKEHDLVKKVTDGYFLAEYEPTYGYPPNGDYNYTTAHSYKYHWQKAGEVMKMARVRTGVYVKSGYVDDW